MKTTKMVVADEDADEDDDSDKMLIADKGD